MRAFLELVEADRVFLPESELPPMEPALLSALRGTGILRDGDPGMVELSPTDLGRTLRKLYAVLSKGLTLPSTFDERPVLLGWTGEGATRREIVLVARPPRGLAWALRRAWRSLVLVPTASALTADMRERHAPGALVEVEALEEVLVARGGRLFRRKERGGPPRGRARRRLGTAAAKKREASAKEPEEPPRVGSPRALLGGARRWSEITVCKVDETLVRFDLPGRSVRCTPTDLGMVLKGSHKPTVIWEALLEVCEGRGTFKTTRFGSIAATTKIISRLREAPRAL